jgi:hypothetical protein
MDDRRTMPRRGGVLTIDLGDLSGPESVEAPSPVSPAVLRRLRVAVVVLLTLFGVVGATPGPTHFVTPLWTRTVSLAGFSVGVGRLTLSDPATKELTGRDLTTGDVRWRVGIPDPAQYVTTAAAGIASVVVRNVDFEETQAVQESDVTLLIDDSGAILTRLPGNQVTATSTTSLLLVSTGQQSVTVGCPPEVDRCSDVAGFDPRTRRQVWRAALPGSLVAGVAGGPERLSRFVMVQPDGAVDVRDPATAGVVRTLRLPAGLLTGGGTPQLLLVGDTLLVAVRGADRAELVAFGVGPAGRDWSASLPVRAAGGGRFFLAACGRLICLHADGADALFDPATGSLRGQVGYQVIGQVGDTLLAVPSPEQPGTPQSRRQVYLLRAVDGQSLGTLADTTMIGWDGGDGWAMLARQGVVGTTFTAIDGYGGLRLLGTMPGGDLVCQASAAILVCVDPGGQLRAWPIPPTGSPSTHR